MVIRWRLVVLVLVLFLAGCGKSSQKLSHLSQQAMQKKDYASAVELLGKALERTDDDGERANLSDKLRHARVLQQSRESYMAGSKCLSQRQYARGFDSLALVAKQSEYYGDAIPKKHQCAMGASEEALQQAEAAHREGDITSAISTLRGAERFGSAQVTNLLSSYKVEMARQLVGKAGRLYSRGSYADAISVLSEAEQLGSSEAARLVPRYRSAQERLQKQKARREILAETRRAKEQANYYEGEGSIQIAICAVQLRHSTDSRVAGRHSTFVLVGVAAKNVGDEIVHVNPNDFTLADQSGTTASHDTETYGLDNYFDAVDLRPGQSTKGWLMFYLPKDSRYTLGYQSIGGGSVEKDVIP